MLRKFPDSFWFGLAFGVASLGAFYFLLTFIRQLISEYYGNPYMFGSPRVQMFSIFLNILGFRFVIVKLGREKTGRGILFATILASFVYFYFFFRYHNSITG